MTVSCIGKTIADNVYVADTFLGRFLGLMGRKSLDDGEGLLLLGCSRIHTFFMKMSIDAVYLSQNYRIIGIETLKPWRLGAKYDDVAHVLELRAGSAATIKGIKLDIKPEG